MITVSRPRRPAKAIAHPPLAPRPEIPYPSPMSFLLRNIARYAAQKLAADPRVREAAARGAQAALEEGRRIAAKENRAYAAGQALGRALHKLRGER